VGELLRRKQLKTIIFTTVNASEFINVNIKLLNIWQILTRNVIWEVSLNIQDFEVLKVAKVNYDECTFVV
jgi:hypothetical protein